nr:hypothetical protein [Tanacetum cinerariifolium]
MALTFANTHNMIEYLTKSDASEGFDQIIDFLNGSSIKKKVIITEATIREALRLDDAESINCLLNEQIFTELLRMGKLMMLLMKLLLVLMLMIPAAHAEPSLPSPTPTTQPPSPSQEIPSTLQVIPTPPPSPIAEPSSPPQQQQPSQPTHDAEILLDLLHTLLETCTTLTRKVEALEKDKVAQALEIIQLKQRVKKLERKNKLKVFGLMRLRKGGQKSLKLKFIDLEHADKVLSMHDDELEPIELKEVVEVVTTAKLMTEVVNAAAAATITAATTPITVAIITAAPSAARKRKGVGFMVEEPKPLKKQAQIKQNEAYARELEAELNRNNNWDDVIEQVQRKEKEDNAVLRYQALKRKPQTEAQAKKNMMIYLRNMAGFKMDYFKGMSYDDIRPIFEKALKRTSESLEEKAAKKQKLDEEVEELKKHLQIVPNNDDDIYTEAIPLALKVPVVDYEIYTENNKPFYKIIRADGSHQLFLSFLSLLKNFDREDLEVPWQIVKERFASLKHKNFSDDFLLTTLTYMFVKPDVKAQVWKSQRGIYGLAKVKSWRLLESCGVHIITLTTTQMILLVERRYPLTRFTLDQMLNNVRLKVEEESKMSLELLRFIRQQQQEGYRPE